MEPHQNLCLRSVHLRSPEEWVAEGRALRFLFTKKGAGSLLAGSVVKSLNSGDVLFLSGTAPAKCSAPTRHEMAFSYFFVDPEQFASIFVGREIAFLRKLLDCSNRIRLFPASSPIAAECQQLLELTPPQFNLAHRSHLLGVAGTILSDEFENAEPEHHGFISFRDRLTQVLEDLSIEEILALPAGVLAAKFNCSRRHLNRLFNDHFGLPVGALRMEMRLAKAAWLLRNPDAKIINVAEESGFNHLGLFNTCFKRRFGMSPTQWRKEWSANSETAADHTSQDPACPMHAMGVCPWLRKVAAVENSRAKEGKVAAVCVPKGSAPENLSSHSARESATTSPQRPGSGITKFRIRYQNQKVASLASRRSASVAKLRRRRVSFPVEQISNPSVPNAQHRCE
jgi:AraC-like DNA-binding protein